MGTVSSLLSIVGGDQPKSACLTILDLSVRRSPPTRTKCDCGSGVGRPLLEEGQQRLDDLGTVTGHLEDFSGDLCEQEQSSSRLDVGADGLGVGPATTELNVRDGLLLKEVASGSTMPKGVG